MKLRHLFPVLLLCRPLLVSAESINFQVLVKRVGLFDKKFTNGPFTGKTTGLNQKTYKNVLFLKFGFNR